MHEYFYIRQSNTGMYQLREKGSHFCYSSSVSLGLLLKSLYKILKRLRTSNELHKELNTLDKRTNESIERDRNRYLVDIEGYTDIVEKIGHQVEEDIRLEGQAKLISNPKRSFRIVVRK